MDSGMMVENLSLSDSDIRTVLRSRLSIQHAREVDSVVIEELGLCRGQVRVDVSVVNGLLHGYEIKSDRDSLRRLNGQIQLYGKVLDRATLVVGKRHLSEARSVLPVWWGIMCVHPSPRGIQFKTVRRPRNNPHRDPRALVELLWFDDAISFLEQRNAARGVRSKPRWMAWDRICQLFGVDEIATAVRAQLKARTAKQVLA